MTGAGRARWALFLLISAAIGVAAVLFALRGPVDPPPGAPAPEPLPPGLSAAERAEVERRHAALQAGGEDSHGHEHTAPALERAGQKFLRFYLPYEVGRAGARVRAGLQRTATAEFAAELLESGPRYPPGLGKAPAEARLLDVEAIPKPEKNEVARILGKLRRARRLEAVAFELRHSGGRWLVSGVAG